MKKSAQTETYTEFDIELAKRIFCSTLSLQMGISYQHCWKAYVEPNLKEKAIGSMYLEIARLIREDLHKGRQGMFSGSIS